MHISIGRSLPLLKQYYTIWRSSAVPAPLLPPKCTFDQDLHHKMFYVEKLMWPVYRYSRPNCKRLSERLQPIFFLKHIFCLKVLLSALHGKIVSSVWKSNTVLPAGCDNFLFSWLPGWESLAIKLLAQTCPNNKTYVLKSWNMSMVCS